ncbi:DUF192 domain-containing protein [Cardiobacteriaceae bacterium TAE3-ERU3]|nr:DUF192 domain-containing protein [Cardiobacteriaceae bacterium TAE3-ERU3]
MTIHFKKLLLTCFFGAILSCHANSPTPQTKLPTMWISDGDRILHVRIAADEHSRARGLMFKPYLLPNEGMLFVFNQPRPVAFWMKNTLIPLDIRFYDSAGNPIAYYPYATPCITAQCSTYPAQGAVRYVLEQRPSSLIPKSIKSLQIIHP